MSETLYMRISTQNIACSQRQMNEREREREREGGGGGDSLCIIFEVLCIHFR